MSPHTTFYQPLYDQKPISFIRQSSILIITPEKQDENYCEPISYQNYSNSCEIIYKGYLIQSSSRRTLIELYYSLV